MGDIYELVLSMDIRADITDDELAELRWHVGVGPRPERLPFGTDNYLDAYPLGDPNDPDCEWETAEPEPAFAQRGAAWKVGGALVAELVRREQPDGWSLTVRQELHPDAFYQLRTLLAWLGRSSLNAHAAGIEFFVGHLRFYESVEIAPLILLDGRIRVPSAVESHTPHWVGA
ncbi:hypothetical protein [Planobispora takensis]|uniref:Uncharacterized protein n=1 Tax=Planobispora takensis TaxID=1367882 RepID=A0A8J3WU46_9ACTN|nr:hypothetical protein [Planobispora takensis]GII01103.1 hypothetical protein Pta02_31110 [Planobispora takensis]